MKSVFSEKAVKIFLVIFIFILSIYAATMIHEVGHVVAYSFLGCNSPVPFVRIDITGGTYCASPENWGEDLTNLEDLFATVSSLIFVSLVGLLLLLGYKYSKFIKKHYILSIIFFSLAFNCFLNGFLQSLYGNDLSEIWALGVSSFYTYLFAGLVGVLLIYTTSQFKDLLKRVSPKIGDGALKTLAVLFWILAILIVSVYLLLPYLFYYLF
jgi:hypothetical protein|tara:strand:- start:332 stop:964 length:633 start_codon:yes stop_codon:yes gene_type:complete